MKPSTTRRYGELALIVICLGVEAAVAVAIVRGDGGWGLYPLLALPLFTLRRFVQPPRRQSRRAQ